MESQTIACEIEDEVAELTLNQPEKRNPLNNQVKKELVDVMEELRDDDEVRVVIITGAGTAFSAGGDINELTERIERDVVDLYSEGEMNVRLFRTISEYEKPVITAVNGHAFGGGCGLVSASHISYAAKDAKLGTSEIKIGTFPLTILPTLRSTIGDRKTLELALTGKSIDATEAKAIGLVTDVANDAESARELARETALELASKSPFAMQLGLRIFHNMTDPYRLDAMDSLKAYRVLLSKSEDLNEGAKAFLEDREPEW